jgi:hypothetical protein
MKAGRKAGKRGRHSRWRVTRNAVLALGDSVHYTLSHNSFSAGKDKARIRLEAE